MIVFASIDLITSIIRERSPPEATLRSVEKPTPLLAENKRVKESAQPAPGMSQRRAESQNAHAPYRV